ncbi:similar to Saccharomyces cerevisiae YBL021C HAP3 Subunit of the heme-activated, glucose-repressed Hap2p/3p/4p/5p CCAAT-binding complex [Geotrichum candidum]|uniref:Similar to Saccharomyces cerevisiae YBL021C HAP3 Subunit of the heme-activated, glucose-repressed Hap2p/3p/4p/5p CCAAT-binding complex n=1 Tax=Geotrichum candidum TaxID=1173061 RepID=A0A0J9X3G3_GEOCN|nr:similar to Saccharomyces cerevisiae YBL021C HAP3 Subunit of the heme-activated, glucose-repressed Hap2p/3p/4p/5p CCAAT-binding complex [Geotrichum candidum]
MSTSFKEEEDAAAYSDGYNNANIGYVIKEQDRWLPIANVARIMKNALPENAKISKEAKECMQECVSEFISFVTSEATERCSAERRKTVNGEDILFALTSLGFENYSEVLKIYLAKYRQSQNGKTQKGRGPDAEEEEEEEVYDRDL